MDESDDSANAEATEHGHPSNTKAARTQATRADGDAEPQFAPQPPKWSNPDPYTALPPPSETTGVKRDVVQLIRKAKNLAAEKAASNNAVAANDDFISFGDDEVDDAPGLRMYENEEPMRGGADDRAPPYPIQDSLRDYDDADDEPRRDIYDSYEPRASGGRKRKADSDVAIVDEWHPRRADQPTPWATNVESYRHLHEQPDKW
jgi:non-canonical poly(A) RNA polymerase PAPD5/7